MITQGSTRSHWCSHTLWTLMKYAETHLNSECPCTPVEKQWHSALTGKQMHPFLLLNTMRNTKMIPVMECSCFQFYSFHDIRFTDRLSVTWRRFLNCNGSISEWNWQRQWKWLLYGRLPWPTQVVLVSNPVWPHDEIVKYGETPHLSFLGTCSQRRGCVRSIEACKIVLQVQERQPLIFSRRDYRQLSKPRWRSGPPSLLSSDPTWPAALWLQRGPSHLT